MDSLHPAVKALVAGKCPKNSHSSSSDSSNSIQIKDANDDSTKLVRGDREDVGQRSPVNDTELTKPTPNK